MNNSAVNFFNQQLPPPQENNSIFSLINQVRQSANPQEAMNQMIASNPQFQDIMNYIAQNGGDAKTAFYNMAAQRNVDPNTILRRLR